MLSALPDPVSGSGPAHVVAALEDIATSVADALLRHIETLPPRTLLLVLGDHGFTIDCRGHITHGGLRGLGAALDDALEVYAREVALRDGGDTANAL